jgi:pimeloyl-ACP methyl ester carboxylesterase
MTADQTLPVLVLLPGLDGTGKLFAEFVEALKSVVECVVVAYPCDQPMGYGELEGLVVSALPKDRPFVLLGESFSGPLAIRIAARAGNLSQDVTTDLSGSERESGRRTGVTPLVRRCRASAGSTNGPADGERLVGLILCVTFAKNPYPSLGWARSMAAYLPVKGLPRWVRAPLMWGSVSPSSAPLQVERAMSGVSAAVVRKRIAELLAVDETAALRQIRIPILVLRAVGDRVVSSRATQVILENSPEAKMVEIDGPHLLLQTRAAECADVVVNFLRALN